MKAFARDFSMIMAAWLLIAPMAARAADACAGPPPALPADMLAQARLGGPYPSFCSIPPVPTGVRAAPAFKAAVIDVRLDGRQLERRTGPETFTIGDTEAFSETLRRQAAPPPPMTTPSQGDTAAFVAAMKAKAAPPPRKH